MVREPLLIVMHIKIILKKHASMLVPLIEEGFIKGPEIELLFYSQKFFNEFINNVDTLILGLYPLSLDLNEIKNLLDLSTNF